jgi:hypothetical protein
MSVMFPDYVLGVSAIALRLWDERLPLKRANDFISPDVSLLSKSVGLELSRCTGRGQPHFHVRWNGRARTRQEWKVLNRYFEFVTAIRVGTATYVFNALPMGLYISPRMLQATVQLVITPIASVFT